MLDIYAREQCIGVIISVGGQTPNNLALQLHHAGLNILGTSAIDIDRAEDRHKFSKLLDSIGVDQPSMARSAFSRSAMRWLLRRIPAIPSFSGHRKF